MVFFLQVSPPSPTTNFSSLCTCRIIRPSSVIPIIFPEKYREALCHVIFVQSYFTFSSLQPDVFLSTTILKHSQLMIFP